MERGVDQSCGTGGIVCTQGVHHIFPLDERNMRGKFKRVPIPASREVVGLPEEEKGAKVPHEIHVERRVVTRRLQVWSGRRGKGMSALGLVPALVVEGAGGPGEPAGVDPGAFLRILPGQLLEVLRLDSVEALHEKGKASAAGAAQKDDQRRVEDADVLVRDGPKVHLAHQALEQAHVVLTQVGGEARDCRTGGGGPGRGANRSQRASRAFAFFATA
jgi:hypothetical protein